MKQQSLDPELSKRFKALIKAVLKNYQYAAAIEKLRIDRDVTLIIIEMLDSLPDREKICLCLRYGITGLKPAMNVAEIATMIGKVKNPDAHISSARAAQIVARGLRMMRHPIRGKRLFALLDALLISK